ncbi:MAG TPA: hypothetical protein VFM80_12365, partial [Gracilimonas sp.]|uniref:hypothetical protein n=1 Tax=Gracilimonas sp. TaxID=1974203 RepID=UPI002DA6FFCB|nr:hypothetical protein [Gracilimonas sp.]
ILSLSKERQVLASQTILPLNLFFSKRQKPCVPLEGQQEQRPLLLAGRTGARASVIGMPRIYFPAPKVRSNPEPSERGPGIRYVR